jgi:hypothetical protein
MEGKMKYTKMLCWVRPKEKKEIIKVANGRFPVEFTKNYYDFKSRIVPGVCPVFSIVKAVRGLKKCQNLVRSFSTIEFFLYYRSNEDGYMTDNEMTLFEEKNIANGQFTAFELVEKYLES